MAITRRTLLQSGAALSASAAQAPSRLPNIVFLISDDHSMPDLGCYGNRAITTPNLDQLAAAGMRFDHCYVTAAQCSPNRSAILTGCFPHTIGTSRLHTPMPDWEPTIIEPLKANGYFTGAFRKVHQGPKFDKRWDFYGDAKQPFRTFFDKRPKDQPFFLHVGFTDPHRPYADGAFRPAHDPAKIRLPEFLPDLPEVRKDLAHYHDEIARMDSECGQVLALLDEAGVAGNTLVVFTGDNGMPFPRGKGTCYDSGLRVPLLARWPGKIQPGSVSRDLISHVDLPPTWLEAAGIAPPAKMVTQGRSFLGKLTGGSYTPRQEIFAERNWHDSFDPQRAVRTDRYKLIFNAQPQLPYRPIGDLYDSPTWQAMLAAGAAGRLEPQHARYFDPSRPLFELYDVMRDPNEFHNLATDPGHRQAFLDLRIRLSEWMAATYDYLPPVNQGGGKSPFRPVRL